VPAAEQGSAGDTRPAAAARRDPRIDALHRVLREHSPRIAPRRPELREAGVALVLRTSEELELLLIERVERAGDPWSGHMALPGGMREAADPDLRVTACRETREEVGIVLAPEEALLGRLDELAPSSPRLPPLVIAPWVAAVPAGTGLVPDPREVATALWVPLSELRDPAARVETLLELDGTQLRFPAIGYRGYEIWGLTYRILQGFFRLAERAW
jgi:8-oxo-dGTP pyrophosphatase MutT (NUDIX family)